MKPSIEWAYQEEVLALRNLDLSGAASFGSDEEATMLRTAGVQATLALALEVRALREMLEPVVGAIVRGQTGGSK